jgi:hypothetical protein
MKSLWILILYGLIGMSFFGCAAGGETTADGQRQEVLSALGDTGKMLKDENLSSIRNFFSEDFFGGYDYVENQILDNWQNQQLIDLKFTVNRILEKDGIYNVQTRWHKNYLDASGNPQRASGLSEILLVPYHGAFKILNISGDRFF